MVVPLKDLITIDSSRFEDMIRAYFLWKELNSLIKNSHTRGVNLHEIISESLLCWTLDFKLNRGKFGDARDSEGNVIEIKATSNWDRDLTSFSPSENFDTLYFVRLNQRDDTMTFYDLELNSEQIKEIPVSKSQTFGEQQAQGRRPRFSIIDKIIEPNNIKPAAELNLRTKETFFIDKSGNKTKK